jgi:hypothetical protein
MSSRQTIPLNTSIKTAYDHQVLEPTNQGDEQLIEMFCGDLDLVEVSVPTQWQTNDDSITNTEEEDQGTAAAGLLEFKLLLAEGETGDRCMRKIPQAIVKVQGLRVPFCLDPVVICKEDTSSWL